MPRIKVALSDEDLSILEEFANGFGIDRPASSHLVATIFAQSQLMRDLRTARRAIDYLTDLLTN